MQARPRAQTSCRPIYYSTSQHRRRGDLKFHPFALDFYKSQILSDKDTWLRLGFFVELKITIVLKKH